MVRAEIKVPIVTSVARPLLAERERTYQLENILAWLHNSDYCGYEVAFAENAGSPIDSIDNAITRRNRPPASFEMFSFSGTLFCSARRVSIPIIKQKLRR